MLEGSYLLPRLLGFDERAKRMEPARRRKMGKLNFE
jgi:hypothetical protein